jgi:hypothetical protein
MLLTQLGLLAVVAVSHAYQVEIHPEYQQGLSINDVPAERRIHWMRVANEVGDVRDASLMTRLSMLADTPVPKLRSVPLSSIRRPTS